MIRCQRRGDVGVPVHVHKRPDLGRGNARDTTFNSISPSFGEVSEFEKGELERCI
jgi:hypothetical protein